MRVDNIKDFDKLVNTYGDIEKLILESKKQISLESSCNFITNEIVKDLVYDIELKSKMLENYTVEFMDISSIITESHIKIKKAHRNKDIELVEGLLNDLLINVINKRKDVVYRGDSLMESYADNVQMIYDSNLERLNSKVIGLTEAIDKKNNSIINTIRNVFASKHDKLVARDKQWLKDNKKKLTSMSYDGVELEVPSDYKVTFANLVNKHDIFDKNFRNGGSPEDIQNKIKRFEDKSGNLKNGLDNYFRTGSSRREIGLRKVSGNEAKNVVSTMIDYCKDFLSGKKLIEDKLDELNSEVDTSNEPKEESKDEVVKEHSLASYLKGDGEEIISPIKGRNITYDFNNSKNITKLLENNLVFISEEKFKDGKILHPRVPKNFLVDNGYEDNSTRRVCFATSIDKALIALSSNLKNKEFFVYKPVELNKDSIIKPTIKQVPDVNITGEVWVTKPVKIKAIKKIKVVDDGDGEYKYRYGNNTAILYDWKWEEVYNIEESMLYESSEEKKEQNKNDDDDWGLEDDPIDDIDTEDNKEEVENNKEDDKKQEEKKEEKPSEEVVDSAKIARDRQTGITVLMTIAEERYFDYIDILKSLLEE